MLAAVSAVKCGNEGLRSASKIYKVPKSTLARYVTSPMDPEESVHGALGRKPVFTKAQEDELVRHIEDMDSLHFGLRNSDLKRLSFQLAEKNNIVHPFNKTRRVAGKKWVRAFLRRHPELSFRTPQAISKARTAGFNPENVGSFLIFTRGRLRKIILPRIEFSMLTKPGSPQFSTRTPESSRSRASARFIR